MDYKKTKQNSFAKMWIPFLFGLFLCLGIQAEDEGTITPNFALGAIQKITLNGNLTFNAFTSPSAGQSITLIIDTNGTNRTLTSTMKFAGGNKTMSTTDTIDVMTVLYDGTNYLANYVTDFS